VDTAHGKLRSCIAPLMCADWEAIADSGAFDDTLVHSLEQGARVSSCSSSEKSSTPSSGVQGPKGRGGAHFFTIRVFCTVTSVVRKESRMTNSLILRLDQRIM
jgi:hypothetical protein